MLKLSKARPYRQRKLASLKKRSFAELSALPERMMVEAPQSLKGLDVIVRREPGERGGVQITVSVGYAGMASTDGFEILPSGKVLALPGYVPEPPRRAKTRPTAGRQKRRGLPRGIKSEVLQYLHLEYGESPRDPDALELSDLSYEGEYQHEGVPTHFWSYPTSSGKSYATVVLSGKSYAIGMTDRRPRGRPRPRSKR